MNTTQMTAQLKDSPLSEIPNVRTLLAMIRKAEKIAANFIQEYNDDETKGKLKSELEYALQEFTTAGGGSLETLNITVYASEYERIRKILHVRIDLTFKAFLQHILLDWALNQ